MMYLPSDPWSFGIPWLVFDMVALEISPCDVKAESYIAVQYVESEKIKVDIALHGIVTLKHMT